jgi:hypothetical protein
MSMDEHLPNGDKTILALQLVNAALYAQSVPGDQENWRN